MAVLQPALRLIRKPAKVSEPATRPGRVYEVTELRDWWNRRDPSIAILALIGITLHLVMRYPFGLSVAVYQLPLIAVLLLGGTPLVLVLAMKVARRRFESDLLAGISIVTSVFLGEYLAGSLVVLMLAGGQTMEAYAVGKAASLLSALARRMPSIAHRKAATGLETVELEAVNVNDTLVVFPHEVCPVDGVVIEGHGVMDESYLTGEPFRMSKVSGSEVLSGSINGDSALTIRVARRAVDSRYEKIMQVMLASERSAPRLRRLGDQLGAIYTPVAIAMALAAWAASWHARRFLAVLVVATPCPLLIAIPVAIMGAISLSARRGIIIKKPIVLEQAPACRTVIFDKTGTLTYGEPRISALFVAAGWDRRQVLGLAASVERYSKHPLARAIILAAEGENVPSQDVEEVSERPGEGLQARVAGRRLEITSRQKIRIRQPDVAAQLPDVGGGLECVVLVDGSYAATFRFRDEPRAEGRRLIRHLGPNHGFKRLMLVSGDRESEVRYLADRVGIDHVYAEQSPEQKVMIVRREVQKSPTLYLGDGINDAAALMAATVGVAMGHNSDITTEAAGAVIMESSLVRFDEFLHIGRRMRRIALQSAVGGMAASFLGMVMASLGYLPPAAGAVCQEIIDFLAVANALRAALPQKAMTDF